MVFPSQDTAEPSDANAIVSTRDDNSRARSGDSQACAKRREFEKQFRRPVERVVKLSRIIIIRYKYLSNVQAWRKIGQGSEAARKVFETVELLELILLAVTRYASIRTVLASQRVCKAFHNTIQGSSVLKQALWLMPEPDWTHPEVYICRKTLNYPPGTVVNPVFARVPYLRSINKYAKDGISVTGVVRHTGRPLASGGFERLHNLHVDVRFKQMGSWLDLIVFKGRPQTVLLTKNGGHQVYVLAEDQSTVRQLLKLWKEEAKEYRAPDATWNRTFNDR